MTVIINSIVKLDKAMKCKKKFPLFPYDHRLVGIYSYYTNIKEEITIFYCQFI